MKEVYQELKKKDNKDLTLKKYKIIPGEQYYIGRSTNCNIHIPHFTISRKHAKFQLSRDLNEIKFEDLDSENGTFVNNKKLIPNKPMEIPIYKEISIGLGDCESAIEFVYVENQNLTKESELNLQCSFALYDNFLQDISNTKNTKNEKQSKSKNIIEKNLDKKFAKPMQPQTENFKFAKPQKKFVDKENIQNGMQSCRKFSVRQVGKIGTKSCLKVNIEKNDRTERRQSRGIEIKSARRSIM